MPQTRFVAGKALALGLKPIVLINKIDRQGAEPRRVHDEVLELFLDLEASPEQFNCPFLYTSSRAGTATADLKRPGTDLKPLFQTILDTIPPPRATESGPFQMLISTLDYSSYLGRIGIGRIERGRVRVGDTVEVHLKNNMSSMMAHSVDFHAVTGPGGGAVATQTKPGEETSFTYKALNPGLFVYHCATPMVAEHISNGMYGAVVVDPETPFEPAAEYVLVQSEFYAKAGANGSWDADVDKMLAVRPDILGFNGVAFQYRDNPLPAKVGEKIRLHVLNAGPTLFSAFHVIGAMFDVVYVDGNPRNPLYGLQTYTIPPGGGATCELTIPEAGQYPFVTHSFAYTELGAIGLLNVT